MAAFVLFQAESDSWEVPLHSQSRVLTPQRWLVPPPSPSLNMCPGYPAANKIHWGMCPGGSHSKRLKSHLGWRGWRYAGASHAWQPWLSSQTGSRPQVSEEIWSQSCPSVRTEQIFSPFDSKVWTFLDCQGLKAGHGPGTRGWQHSITRASAQWCTGTLGSRGIPQDCPKRKSRPVLRTLGDEYFLNREQRNFISSFILFPLSFLLFILWS